MQLQYVIAALVIVTAYVVGNELRRLKRIEYRLAELLLRVGNAARCPTCGHPVIVGAFHDGDFYTCLECGEQYTWELKDGHYVLARKAEHSGD